MFKRNVDSPKVIAHPPIIFAAGFLIGLLLNNVANLSFGLGDAIKLGWIFIVGGVGIAGWAAWVMSAAGTGIPTNVPATELVVKGPFLRTRNPIYIGLTLAYLGLASLMDAPLALLMMPVILMVMHAGVVLREEAYLEQKFGEAYTDYCAKTKRYF